MKEFTKEQVRECLELVYEDYDLELVQEHDIEEVLPLIYHLATQLNRATCGVATAVSKRLKGYSVKVHNAKQGWVSVSDLEGDLGTGVSETTAWYPFDRDGEDLEEEIRNVVEMVSEAYYTLHN